MDRVMTSRIKSQVLSSGMDLIGFAPVSRWKNAPFLISPGAILPESKTVIVGAIHTTDTWIEMGGEPQSQDASPGGWMDQNSLLDTVSYKTSKLLQAYGYKAIPIVSSNIWRYRLDENIGSPFAPDLSHMHAAVAAGLGELGWSGLAITPEFGPRVRFFSIVTDAELEPTPMYDGPKLCDMCGECINCCPSRAMNQDFNDSKPHVVEIGGKTYKYANKNIWRCAWAEHFNLNLDSETLKNGHIDENVILKEIADKGVRGHERGVCQKVCIPPHLRTASPSFGRENKKIAMNRINKRYPDVMPTLRKMRDDIIARAAGMGIDLTAVSALNPESPAAKLIDVRAPGMKTVLGFAFEIPREAAELSNFNSFVKEPYNYALPLKMHFSMLKLAKLVEEYGFKAAAFFSGLPVSGLKIPAEYNSSRASDPINLLAYDLAAAAGVGKIDDMFITPEFGSNVIVGAIVTDAVLPGLSREGEYGVKRRTATVNLKETIRGLALKNDVDLFGIANANAFNETIIDLKANINEDNLGSYVTDVNPLHYHGKYIPKIMHEDVRFKTPADYLEDAKSVIVLGMGFPDELIENAGLPQTKQIGPYAYWTFQTIFELRRAAVEIAKKLNEDGYKTLISENLTGIGGRTDTPRGKLPDFRCGAIEAFAAGLGEIGKQGGLLTPEFGANQRFITIITNADIEADEPYKGEKICTDCGNCSSKCSIDAVCGGSFALRIANQTVEYPNILRNRCDWAKRYSLHQNEGTGLLGVTTHELPAQSGEVSIQEIAAACENKDPVTKSRTTILEPCLRYCEAKKRRI